jgi:hypothetical protein
MIAKRRRVVFHPSFGQPDLLLPSRPERVFCSPLKIQTLAELGEMDPIIQRFTPYGLGITRILKPEAAVEYHQRTVDVELGTDVLASTRKSFERLQQTHVAGILNYEPFSVARGYSLADEAARIGLVSAVLPDEELMSFVQARAERAAGFARSPCRRSRPTFQTRWRWDSRPCSTARPSATWAADGRRSRLSEPQARLYQEWIANRRRLTRKVAEMEKISQQAGEILLRDQDPKPAQRARTQRPPTDPSPGTLSGGSS